LCCLAWYENAPWPIGSLCSGSSGDRFTNWRVARVNPRRRNWRDRSTGDIESLAATMTRFARRPRFSWLKWAQGDALGSKTSSAKRVIWLVYPIFTHRFRKINRAAAERRKCPTASQVEPKWVARFLRRYVGNQAIQQIILTDNARGACYRYSRTGQKANYRH